jgi:hypothetical protein
MALRFLTSVLNEGEYPASRPGRASSEERAPDPHLIGGKSGPQSQSGRCEEKNLLHLPRIKFIFLSLPSRSLVVISTELSRLQNLYGSVQKTDVISAYSFYLKYFNGYGEILTKFTKNTLSNSDGPLHCKFYG